MARFSVAWDAALIEVSDRGPGQLGQVVGEGLELVTGERLPGVLGHARDLGVAEPLLLLQDREVGREIGGGRGVVARAGEHTGSQEAATQRHARLRHEGRVSHVTRPVGAHSGAIELSTFGRSTMKAVRWPGNTYSPISTGGPPGRR